MEQFVEKIIRVQPGTFKERLIIKKVPDAHKFLNSQYDNVWKLSERGWKAGTYAFAGGKWHNVKDLDSTVLAHI
jgi:hypothetical protein